MINNYKEEYFDSLKALDERIKELKKKRYKGYKLSIYICKYDYYQGKHRLGYIWKKVGGKMTKENFIKKTIESLEDYLHYEMWRHMEPPFGREECELFLELLTQKEGDTEENDSSENLIDREQLIDDLIHFNGPINYVNVKRIILNQSVCHKTDIYKGRRN